MPATYQRRRGVFAYPAIEQLGAIWAFNGPDPLFDVPMWRDYEPSQLVTRIHMTEPVALEPWVLITNSYDFVHLRELHGMQFEFDPADVRFPNPYVQEYDLTFEMPGIGTMEQRIRTCGTNTVALCAVVNGEPSMALFSATPTRTGHTETYSFAGTPDVRDGTDETDAAIEIRLQLQEAFSDQLLADDIPVLTTVRFKEGALIPEDRMLGRYLRFARQFPRMDPSGFFE